MSIWQRNLFVYNEQRQNATPFIYYAILEVVGRARAWYAEGDWFGLMIGQVSESHPTALSGGEHGVKCRKN